MNVSLSQNLTKFLLIFGIVAFLLVGFFGGGLLGIHMGSPEQEVSGCHVMGMTTVCQMNPLEHIAAWQSMFVSLLPNSMRDTFALLLVFLLFVFSAKSSLGVHLFTRPSDQKIIRISKRVISIIRNPLAEAFSNGILNPKIF